MVQVVFRAIWIPGLFKFLTVLIIAKDRYGHKRMGSLLQIALGFRREQTDYETWLVKCLLPTTLVLHATSSLEKNLFYHANAI